MFSRSVTTLSALTVVAVMSVSVFAGEGSGDTASIDNPDNCRIVERAPGESQDGVSASVTAGGGKATARTSGGHGVTVHSGDGSVSSSVATTGRGSRTTVTTSDGDCIIYVNPGEKKEK